MLQFFKLWVSKVLWWSKSKERMWRDENVILVKKRSLFLFLLLSDPENLMIQTVKSLLIYLVDQALSTFFLIINVGVICIPFYWAQLNSICLISLKAIKFQPSYYYWKPLLSGSFWFFNAFLLFSYIDLFNLVMLSVLHLKFYPFIICSKLG